MDLERLAQRLEGLRGIFDIPQKENRLKELERRLEDPSLWNDPEAARKVSQEAARLRRTVDTFRSLESDLQGLLELMEELPAEERESLKPELEEAAKKLDELYHQTLLNFPHAEKNAILTIQPGAGGTEACDWAEMLLRMYTRFAERQGFQVEVVDLTPGPEAGIDYAQILVKGENAYGLLSPEAGVHRLVRPSPFDASGRRHTSFAGVEVIPEVDEDVEVVLKPEELRIDVMRASGPGGQGVNTTDSAVRVVHLPTGITVTCQTTRSQIKNKELALKILKARLYELERKKREEELKALRGEVRPIEWGSQIRSYVLDKNYVKDHRTGLMRHDPENVLDGDLMDLIWAGLEWKAGRRQTAEVEAE
ncbi:peptide chain release factor 2 [Thermus parvatiensis]|uniref:Peptide chain release factor 2 n=1 Tax=Thermus parvatiensis TaxID=456163 RepID=A0A109QFI9_9DEIN|nr:peptide chain release factor 2 [Thermus parvatiensis]AMA76163.1 peptide chain release factor 2 [Thermus parvatiensis]